MDTAATRTRKYSVEGLVLYLAFELGNVEWKLGFSVGFGQRPRVRTIAVRDLEGLQREIELAKKRFGLPETAWVVSCYEAGRDGFWLHRYLVEAGVENLVVDSSSIEVNRRFRRAKTDRMDVAKLLDQLMRYERGEKKVWRVVRVPGVEAEDRRQFHRELEDLKAERTRHINRMKGLLAGQGVRLEIGSVFVEKLSAIRLWDGRPIPEGLRARLEREYKRLQFIQGQIRELEGQRVEAIRRSADPEVEKVRQLLRLKGIGLNSAWVNTMEFFSWREFRNAKEVGALAGLTPTPYQSGDSSRERGMSKAGNRHVRALAIEIAWGWLRYQPESELSRWYQRRFGDGSSRVRRIGIVALARKLLIALWRYLETGLIPQGAVLKTRLI
ncbi:MAG TPA: IS110 family transposase [Anaerolineales bacterium]|nr:IS110 family transposase [Anaerolineales bacterium]